MRAERVFDLAWDVRADFTRSNIIPLLTDLEQGLRNLSTAPSEAAEQNVTEVLDRIREALPNSIIENYSPAQFAVVREIEISGLFGRELLARIEGVLSRSSLLPTAAADEIKAILDDVTRLSKSATALVAALPRFGVPSDDLNPGEFEIMVGIPGPAISNELPELGREAVRLNNILGVFVELSTGSREPFKLRGLSSTDPTFFLHSAYAAAALIATAIERIAKFYETMQSIVQTHRDMKAYKAPPELLEGIQSFLDSKIEAGLKQIAEEIEKKHRVEDAGRRKELKIELRKSLLELAKRIDEGYRFDVRGAAVTEKNEDGQDVLTNAPENNALRVVDDARAQIQHFEPSPEPILRLKGDTRLDDPE